MSSVLVLAEPDLRTTKGLGSLLICFVSLLLLLFLISPSHIFLQERSPLLCATQEVTHFMTGLSGLHLWSPKETCCGEGLVVKGERSVV